MTIEIANGSALTHPDVGEGTVLRHAYLISARTPGSGSSTVGNMLAASLGSFDRHAPVHLINIGDRVKGAADFSDEFSLNAAIADGLVPTDVRRFDAQFYAEARGYPITIVDGKLATQLGPSLLPASANVTAIDLQCDPVVAATRIMRREGVDMVDFVGDPERVARYLSYVIERSSFIAELEIPTVDVPNRRETHIRHHFDTGLLRPEEIVATVTGNTSWQREVATWEREAVAETLNDLERLRSGIDVNPRDAEHYDFNHARASYFFNLLRNNANPSALPGIRENIRAGLIHSFHALLMKGLPRFAYTPDRQVVPDMESQRWSPEYYKIAAAWPTLRAMLKDKTVLDPFAGAGTYLNILAARGLTRNVTYGDIAYWGGRPINGGTRHYAPKLNTAMLTTLFDRLPSFYKPSCFKPGTINGHATMNASNLPFGDGAFDLVSGDPPYGIQHSGGSVDTFIGYLPELLRVSREGCMMLVPVQWASELSKRGVPFQDLTGDLSNGNSGIPTAFVHFPK